MTYMVNMGDNSHLKKEKINILFYLVIYKKNI